MNTNYFKSFQYKPKLLENTVADGNNLILKNATITVPLKYLSNFWQSFEMSLINCKVIFKLRWMKLCVLASGVVEHNNANSSKTIFTIKCIKLFVPVVTLSAKDNKKLLKILRTGFE